MSPAIRKLEVVFRRRAWGGSGPMRRTFLPMAERYGVTVSSASNGPAVAKRTVPAKAAGEAPKTGVARKMAPAVESFEQASLAVDGWTVDVSARIFPVTSPEDVKDSVRESKTVSSAMEQKIIFEFWTSSDIVVYGVAPIAFRESPLERVRFV